MGNASGSKMAARPSRPNSSGSGGIMDTTVISNGPRKSTVSRPPMPTEEELDRRFNELLIQMDLPPERAQILMHFPTEKKWDTICDHNMVHAKDPPETYLSKLRLFLDPHGAKATRKLDSTSTQILRDLEISLRTNPIEWVREFLSEASRGLDILIEYLSSRLHVMRQKLELDEEDLFTSVDSMGGTIGTLSSSAKKINLSIRSRKSSDLTRNEFRKSAKRDKDRKLGDVTDDIHLCIMCMRAIMNNKFGFNMVIKHKQAINSIALSLIHERLRTKALVLELLAAICLLKGGHEIILSAFDSFKQEMRETHRFQTLVSYFTNPSEFQIEFMVACMQFINIVVHSVEDMNFRVALQYEFTYLGLDECLEHLKNHESDELAVQISAYVDNEFDVAAIMEEAEAKQAALDQVQDLEEELGRAKEMFSELEADMMSKEVQYEKRIDELQTEVNLHKEQEEKVRSEYSTLKKSVEKEEVEKKKRQSVLEIRIKELEMERDSLKSASTTSLNSNLSGGGGAASTNGNAGKSSIAAAPPPPPPPPMLSSAPPPPPPPMMMGKGGGPPPPPPPGIPGAPRPPGMGIPAPPRPLDLPIKPAVVPNNRLPTLQIHVIPPRNINNTVWYTMGDKVFNDLDFAKFEEAFKLNAGPGVGGSTPGSGGSHGMDGGIHSGTIKPRQPQLETLLENTRLKNVAICKRRLPQHMTTDDLIANVNALDNAAIGLDAIELLQRIMPTPEEIKAYKDYTVVQKKDLEKLTEEDRLMSKLSEIQRLGTKLDIMSFMSTFYENAHAIKPRIEAVYLASKGTRNSRKFQKILEIILAFGNYMNSSKKGSAYGFKLSSLDNLHTTKSSDKRSTIVNYIVDVVHERFPEVKGFEADLKHVEKASHAHLDNILQEVQDLEKRMAITQRELVERQKNPTTQAKKQQNLVLKNFVENASEMLTKLSQDAKNAKAAFADCVEFYGDSAEATDTNTFFGILVRFCHRWKETVEENEKRRKLELARRLAAENNNELNQGSIQQSFQNNQHQRNGGGMMNKKEKASMISEELKSRNRRPLYKAEEVKDGTLEQIIMGIKSEPYRTNDAMRRSVRRNVDRMTSRPFDEDL